jgi:hypothetical protein
MEEKSKDLADILRALPAGTPLLLPDELLGLWFPPGIVGGVLDPGSRKSAEEYGAHFNCLFSYAEDEHQGYFAKQISN